MEPSDAELVVQRRWEALVDRHGPAILSAFRAIRRSEAEDLFQEFWLRLMEDGGRRLAGFDPSRPLRPWLTAVALNLAKSRMARSRPALLESEPVAPPDGPREELAEALQAMEGLTSRDRLLIELAGVEGRSAEEVGALLGVAPQSVRSLLSRARERLKSEIPRFKEGARKKPTPKGGVMDTTKPFGAEFLEALEVPCYGGVLVAMTDRRIVLCGPDFDWD